MSETMNQREPLEPTYTVSEVARHYHVTATTVRRWVERGHITAINVSRSRKGPLVFRRQDLEEFEATRFTTKPMEGQADG